MGKSRYSFIALVMLFGFLGRADAQESFRRNIFADMESQSWANVLEQKEFRYRAPYTVNLVIHPVHSPDWIFVNPSMAVSRRTVPPGVVSSDAKKRHEAEHQEDMLMQFAFDEPAFMPDFNLVNMSLKDNRYPVATADYYANDLYYRIEYASTSLEDGQTVLGINIWVKNEGYVDRNAVVRVKLGYYDESSVFDYHYIPYFWDNSKWKPYDKVSFADNVLYKEGKPIGEVVPDGMSVEWEESRTYTDEDYEKSLYPQVWYGSGYALPPYRLKSIDNVIRASQPLKPEETAHFSLKLLVNDANADAEQFAQLQSLSSEQIVEKSMEAFKSELSPETTIQYSFNKNHYSDILTAEQLCIKQLLIGFPGTDFYQTAQGGSSERFYTWVFEAVHMLRSSLRTGQFDDVRKGLAYIFSLQDAGVPPEGRVTTTEGSIGTTGPRWCNTTGMALVLASEYCLYSHDEAFLEEYLPKMLKAVHWIEGEVKATRKLNEDGSRPLVYGLMPWGVGCDGDVGYCLSDTDIFTYWGFNKMVLLLERIGHEDAASLRKEVDEYRDCILYTVGKIARPDGYIPRNIVETAADAERLAPKFEITDNVIPLGLVGLLDPSDKIFLDYLDFFERSYADGEFLGGLDREIMYTNQCEHNFQQIYLKKRDWKKAFSVTQTCLRYGMSQDAFQTSERMSKRNPAFAPWQPNGSANGRIIDILLNAFYYENDESTVTLLGTVPYSWLEDEGGASISNLYTFRGKESLNIERKDAESFVLTLSADGKMPEYVRIPEHYSAAPRTYGVKKVSEGLFSVKDGLKKIEFVLREGEQQ